MDDAPPGYTAPRFRPTQCGATIAVCSINDDPGEASRHLETVRVRCKSWREPGCGRWLRQLHGRLIEAGYTAHPGQVWRFLTLTWPTDEGALVTSAADCASTSLAFRRWVQAVRRTYGPLDYYVVKEATRRGRLHLHALATGVYLPKCRSTLPGGCVFGCDPCRAGACHRPAGCCAAPGRRPCIQALARRYGIGYLDIRMVRGEGRGAARYVGKYLGKQHIGQRWPRHSRRCSYSRHLAPGVTIGRLAVEWQAAAYARGVEAGHIAPRYPYPLDPTFTRYRLASDLWRRGPPVAWLIPPASLMDPDTGEIIEAPGPALSETALLRRHNRRTETEARIIAPDLDTLDPGTRRLVYAEAARRARTAR